MHKLVALDGEGENGFGHSGRRNTEGRRQPCRIHDARCTIASLCNAEQERELSFAPTVDLGINSSYDFFFEVVMPNFNDLRKQPPKTILNAAWSFWHMHEWYFWDKNPTASDKGRRNYVDNVLLQECPELGWLRDIADAGKHRRLIRPSVKVREISICEIGGPDGAAPWGAVPCGGTMEELEVDVGGTTYDLPLIMHRAFIYWLGRALPYHVEVHFTPENLCGLSDSILGWCNQNIGDKSKTRKWKWQLLDGATAPHYIQRLAFFEAADAQAFERWWTASTATP